MSKTIKSALALAAWACLGSSVHAQTAQPVAPSAPVASWQGGPVTPPGAGGPVYCATQNRFDNGLGLVIARTPQGESNIAVAIPGAQLKENERFTFQVDVDGEFRRRFEGAAVQPTMIVIPTGRDNELFDRIGRGNRLTVQGPQDTVSFQLKGTAKALSDLKSCAERLAGGAPGGQAAQGGQGGAARPPLPPSLQAILARSGLKELQVLNMERLPPEKRPADFAWRFDGVFGGVRELNAAPGSDFVKLGETYNEALKRSCAGTFEVTPAAVSKAGSVQMRTADATCTTPERKINVALLYYLTETNIFTVFFHEATDDARAKAVSTRDGIARTIRELAEREAQSGNKPG